MSDNCFLSRLKLGRSLSLEREPKHVQHPQLEKKISDNDCAHAKIHRKHKTLRPANQLRQYDKKEPVALICLFKR